MREQQGKTGTRLLAGAARRTEGSASCERRGQRGPGASVSPGRGPQSSAPSDVAGLAGPDRPPGGASTGRTPGGGFGDRVWRPRPREAEAWAGGGRRGGHADSHRIDPPAASRGGGDSGPGQAAATPAAPRDRRPAESRSGAGRGRRGAWVARCLGAAGGGDPRPRDAPLSGACAAPCPRWPLPRPGAPEGR